MRASFTSMAHALVGCRWLVVGGWWSGWWLVVGGWWCCTCIDRGNQCVLQSLSYRKYEGHAPEMRVASIYPVHIPSPVYEAVCCLCISWARRIYECRVVKEPLCRQRHQYTAQRQHDHAGTAPAPPSRSSHRACLCILCLNYTKLV